MHISSLNRRETVSDMLADPAQSSLDLSSLVASRLCHDLISPIGAIGNGIELLQSISTASEELDLIGQSADTARAKLAFFRVAFGAAKSTEAVAAPTLKTSAETMINNGRLTLQYATNRLSRGDAKLMFLMLLCCESALPFGGTLTARDVDNALMIDARAERVKLPEPVWDHMLRGTAVEDVIPAHVHFPLTRITAAQADRAIGFLEEPGGFRLFAA